jgi:hypothetical protein
MTAAPPPWPPGQPDWSESPGHHGGRGHAGDTGERLRAALSARSAQVGPEIAAAERYGGSGDRTGYTSRLGDQPGGRAGYGGQAGYGNRTGYGDSPGPGGRPPLLPRWGKAALGVALVLSAALGVVLGLRPADDENGSAALPPPRETSYNSDRARVAITSFVRSGKFVTLELELTNLAPLGSDDTWSVSSSLGTSSSYDLSGIRLLDPAAGTVIRPAEDADGECICSDTTGLSIVAGSSTRVSAQFPAPGPDVKKLNIDIPGAGSFRDVRLS